MLCAYPSYHITNTASYTAHQHRTPTPRRRAPMSARPRGREPSARESRTQWATRVGRRRTALPWAARCGAVQSRCGHGAVTLRPCVRVVAGATLCRAVPRLPRMTMPRYGHTTPVCPGCCGSHPVPCRAPASEDDDASIWSHYACVSGLVAGATPCRVPASEDDDAWIWSHYARVSGVGWRVWRAVFL